MALPHRKQMLATFIYVHDLTRAKVAEALGVSPTRVSNLIRGHIYPTVDEIAGLERLFGMPIEVLLEEDLLTYRDGTKPLTGYALLRAENERLRKLAGE